MILVFFHGVTECHFCYFFGFILFYYSHAPQIWIILMLFNFTPGSVVHAPSVAPVCNVIHVFILSRFALMKNNQLNNIRQLHNGFAHFLNHFFQSA